MNKYRECLSSLLLCGFLSSCNLGANEHQRWPSPGGCYDAVLMIENTDATSNDFLVLYIVDAGKMLSSRAQYVSRGAELSEDWSVEGEVLVGVGLRDDNGIFAGPDLVDWNGDDSLMIKYSEGSILHYRSRYETNGPAMCPGRVEVRIKAM